MPLRDAQQIDVDLRDSILADLRAQQSARDARSRQALWARIVEHTPVAVGIRRHFGDLRQDQRQISDKPAHWSHFRVRQPMVCRAPYIEWSATLCRVHTMASLRLTTQTLAVLSTVLSDPDADWYGLELCKHARLKPGTIYPILDRLLKADWLERRWEDIDPTVEGRPRRRLYRLTGIGAPAARQALDEHLASLQRPAAAETWRPVPGPRPA